MYYTHGGTKEIGGGKMFFDKLFGNSRIKQINTHELRTAYLTNKSGKVFIDVRTKQEFKEKHIKGFENHPLQNLETRLNKVPKDKEVVVVCRSGARSASACKILTNNGYKDVTNVSGGTDAWY